MVLKDEKKVAEVVCDILYSRHVLMCYINQAYNMSVNISRYYPEVLNLYAANKDTESD